MSVSAKTIFMLSANAGSSLFDAGEPLPDTDGVYQAGAVDLGTGVPESGDGTLERITVDVGAAAPAGQYNLLISSPAHLDGNGSAYIPDTVAVGAIAVGQACGPIVTPSPTPSPSPTPVPTDTPTPSPTPVPTASPSPSPSPTPCVTNCPTVTPSPTPTPVAGAGTATPSRTPSPRALPPTGTSADGGGTAAPLALGAASLVAIAMALGGFELTRRLRREA